jgi:hypothetical protein
LRILLPISKDGPAVSRLSRERPTSDSNAQLRIVAINSWLGIRAHIFMQFYWRFSVFKISIALSSPTRGTFIMPQMAIAMQGA